MGMEKVIISIIDYNGRDDTIACLRSLEKLVTENFVFEVVIIDNYPQGFFSLGDEKFDIPITLIKTSKALGFAGGQNKGIEFALKQDSSFQGFRERQYKNVQLYFFFCSPKYSCVLHIR